MYLYCVYNNYSNNTANDYISDEEKDMISYNSDEEKDMISYNSDDNNIVYYSEKCK